MDSLSTVHGRLEFSRIQAESGQLKNRPLYLLIKFVDWAGVCVI